MADVLMERAMAALFMPCPRQGWTSVTVHRSCTSPLRLLHSRYANTPLSGQDVGARYRSRATTPRLSSCGRVNHA